MADLYLSAPGLVSPFGLGLEANAEALFTGQSGLVARNDLLLGRTAWVGAVTADLPPLPADFEQQDCRNNRMLRLAMEQIRPQLDEALAAYGAERIAVVLGSSTAGMDKGEAALAHWQREGALPADFDYERQALGSVARFAADYLGIKGPAYSISTACSSSGKAFASGQRLIKAGLADAVLVGGVDSLCRLTLNGFKALESVAPGPCTPFGEGRQGISIGEGAAVFLLSKKKGEVRLAGVGESSDGYHISAPEPEGKGARLAMDQALAQAGIQYGDIGYVNLHGTGTPKNDEMEAGLMARCFGAATKVSTSKAQVGHALGAAGALEAAFGYLALTDPEGRLPPQLWRGPQDPALPELNYAALGDRQPVRYLMSNSYAFGGSNVSVVLANDTRN
ncbi:beta-ketoacyl-[acyl-carrier-protein] synthase family protein [Gallaecimonas kandeliae]|uniref:beta-ketoacyl-[acyl-carrier-protein] synthase family protein n=1 Tax=Gallaecimonas kandeliae TaxID=3029055 RepID=UPI00264A0D28|nr:beta-ketoacyl-[acyl-carrier-protein] synthase family protein [Gallaecimonas kandeliae]WKE63990.1 beta-ketoacyl-[acyl-carrier-protein] synthase family protein [Gallaecimonas kandeliae]